MTTENTFKDPRLLEALEYLDKKFITEVFDDLKVPDMSDYVPGKRKPFTLWKQFAVLAACLILLMFATPLFSKVAEVISSFAAGWGSGMTEEMPSPHTLSDTTENETISETDVYTTTELHESVLTPNYLKFVSDLEPISEEMMLEIRETWPKYKWNYWFDRYYTAISGSAMQYTEAEARTIAEQYADDYTRGTEYIWFVLSVYNDKGDIAYKYRYYGMIGEYAVLVEYRNTTFNYSDENLYKKIGDHTFYFKAGGEIYLYKDGVFVTMKEVYDQGLISDDDVSKIANRHVSYEAFFEKWRKDAYYQYFAELTE